MEKGGKPGEPNLDLVPEIANQVPSENHRRLIKLADSLLRHGQIDESLAVFDLALEATNDAIENQAEVHYELGQAYRGIGEYQKALEALELAYGQAFLCDETGQKEILLHRVEEEISMIVADLLKLAAQEQPPVEPTSARRRSA